MKDNTVQNQPGALERLVGTESLRAADTECFNEEINEVSEVLVATSKLLEYYGTRVNDGEEVTYSLPTGLVEVLQQQSELLIKIRDRANRLFSPPAVVVPPSEVKFNSPTKSKGRAR